MSDAQESPAQDDSGVEMDEKPSPKYKFSDALRSRTIKIITTQGAEFYVHEELLCRESERFKKQLRGDFKEVKTGEITDFDECPELLGMFFEYLYRDGPLHDEHLNHGYEFRILARLYCMAERLSAKAFQDTVFWKFQTLFHLNYLVDELEIFQTLVILHTELPEKKRTDYPLRRLALWWTASRLSNLKKTAYFKRLILEYYPELASQLLMLVEAVPEDPKPYFPSVDPTPRFEVEVKFAKEAAKLHKPAKWG
ncbi:hypothetical protein IWZ01DRAFT_353262 [Phyllosticta capitalensis]